MSLNTHALGIPWAITEYGLQIVLAVATRGEVYADVLEKARLRAEADGDMGRKEPYSVQNTVAIIPVRGVLCRHADLFSDVSGATSYERIDQSLRAALTDQKVRSILLKVDSPGGISAGCSELAALIRAADSTKPVLCYVDGLGCSAAYWIGCAAQKLWCSPSSFLGSLGARSAIRDESKAEEQRGVKIIEVVSSQTPNKRSRPVDDSVVGRLQAKCDDVAAMFLEDVAKYRGVSAEKIECDYAQGDDVIASKALTAGLVDEISSLDAALAEARRMGDEKLSKSGGLPSVSTKRGNTMKNGTLAERLTALATHEGLSAETRSELTALAADAQQQALDLIAAKTEIVNLGKRAEKADYDALIRAAKSDDGSEHSRKITSPAQEAKVRELFTSFSDLSKHLQAMDQQPKLSTPRPAVDAEAAQAQSKVAQESALREHFANQRGYTTGAGSVQAGGAR